MSAQLLVAINVGGIVLGFVTLFNGYASREWLWQCAGVGLIVFNFVLLALNVTQALRP
jgi:hypothetical protein